MRRNLPIDVHSFRGVEVLTGTPRWRRWTDEEISGGVIRLSAAQVAALFEGGIGGECTPQGSGGRRLPAEGSTLPQSVACVRLTHLEVEDRTASAAWDNAGRDDARHPARRHCRAARRGADGLGRARCRAGREWAVRRPERPIAPPASPAAADAVRSALGKARSRPVQPGPGRSRTGGRRDEAEQEKADPARRQARSEKRRAGRGPLPEHLSRVEIVTEPEDSACPCCGGAMHVIGEDRSQRLDVVPAQYQVIVTRRPKYACRICQAAVVQAPARLIEGGLPTERLIAQSSLPNMPTTARCTARPKFWRGKELRSVDRCWRSGSAEPPPRSNLCGG